MCREACESTTSGHSRNPCSEARQVNNRSQLMLASWSSLMTHLALPKQKETEVTKETVNIAGLLTNVYSRSDLRTKNSAEPVVVLFILHGRLDSSDTVDPTARAAFAWAAKRQASSGQNPRDFVVATFVRAVSSSESSSLLFFPAEVRTSFTWSGFGRETM